MGKLADTLSNTIESFTAEDLKGCTQIAPYVFYGCAKLTSVEIPATVTSIGAFAFNGTSKIATIKFLHPTAANITLPTAGSSTGMFYQKTARAVNIYTDNETIKNYAWSSDGVTATFYHLNGTAWE